MKLLLDANMNDRRLASRLRAQGHDPILAGDVGLLSAADPRVLIWAIGQALPVLTRVTKDFRDLHELIVVAGGHHPGLLLVYFDDIPATTWAIGPSPAPLASSSPLVFPSRIGSTR
jgi:predicted nuclease of predicted toxin-antitoxin system